VRLAAQLRHARQGPHSDGSRLIAGEETRMAYPASGPVHLEVNLADSAITKALKDGEVKSELVSFDYVGPKVANQGFKPMLREGKFDGGELAIVTYLQAREFGKPLVLLPAAMVGRFQHSMLVYNSEKFPPMSPKDLEGKRVGIRSYTQTTGMWIRGHLKNDFGVDLDKVTWVCWDDPHPAEYKDPAFVQRVPPGSKNVDQMLLDGDIDAAIPGYDVLKNPIIKPIIPDVANAGRAFYAKYKGVSVNHLFVVREELSRERPDVVREIYRMLLASKKAAGLTKEIDDLPFGISALRSSLELAIQYCLEQKLITRKFTVDELFDDVTRTLDV
jgi:4,5-dihydroxyphthalate decarboxylase